MLPSARPDAKQRRKRAGEPDVGEEKQWWDRTWEEGYRPEVHAYTIIGYS